MSGLYQSGIQSSRKKIILGNKSLELKMGQKEQHKKGKHSALLSE
jgi:hypothetical protein